jgi:hypothetical protein
MITATNKDAIAIPHQGKNNPLMNESKAVSIVAVMNFIIKEFSG